LNFLDIAIHFGAYLAIATLFIVGVIEGHLPRLILGATRLINFSKIDEVNKNLKPIFIHA
jgi:hypothetical protein